MATITIRKELQYFLEKEGILESFLDNVEFDSKYYGAKVKRHAKDISSAFIWGNSERKGEGYDYWYSIHNKWSNYKEEKGIK